MSPATRTAIRTGIEPFDERTGGLQAGGTYLVVGAPGPAKMVAALQFLHEGVSNGEPALLVTNADIDGILEAARAWGLGMDEGWETGVLQIVGFREDFELRAIRSIEPEEVLEELDELVSGTPARIAVDPGAMFLTGGAKTLLGSAFIAWAHRQEGTVLTTFSVDGDPQSLPSSADWLLNATTGRMILQRRSGGLYQIRVARALPGAGEREETVSLELKPGAGLVQPESYPSDRGVDRGAVDRNRLLLVSLGGSHATDLDDWASRAFDCDIVSEPFEAVARVQADPKFGCILVHAPRRQVREAVQACRALRPLTRAAIVFASDDAVRSTDRIHILEAGADDCLSGGLDFRELSLRIKQSMAAGARPALEIDESASATVLGASETDGGRVSREILRQEIERRAEEPNLAFFCVLVATSGVLTPSELEDGLAELVRSDEGDLVSQGSDSCVVLLQGARASQLGPFLKRVRSSLEERAGEDDDPGLEVSVLSHPADSDRIQELLGTSGGEED